VLVLAVLDFFSSRGGSWMVCSASFIPACSSRPRSISALNSAPNRIAMFVSQSHTRKLTTAPREPYVLLYDPKLAT
jgi:hypothetical protein